AVANTVVLLQGMDQEIDVTSVRADTEATCNAASGSTQITGLTIGGAAPTRTGEGKQTIEVPGVGPPGLNEQIVESAGGVQSITVNALRLVTIEPSATIIVASAHSDLAGCAAPCRDFVTGGGWIPIDGDRGNFGFNAGYKPNSTTPTINFN